MRVSFLTKILLGFCLSFQILALEYDFVRSTYPTKSEANLLVKSDPVTLSICCYYPDSDQVDVLNDVNLKELNIKAGFFPTTLEISRLDKLKFPYKIELSEVFPGKNELDLINNSKVSLLTINSKDFLTLGEVKAFNKFKVPLRININHREYPLPRHMKNLKKLNSSFTVGFRNHVPPGPGYANFFNDLKTKKVFNVTKQFLYGDDHIGINLLTKSSLELTPSEYIRPQDLFSINSVNLKKVLYLGDQRPYTQETIGLIKNIIAEKTHIRLFEGQTLADDVIDQFRDAKSNIVITQ